MKKAVPYLLAAGVFLLLACNNLLTKGMHMDGLIYTSIADNLAHGTGTPLHLTYTKTAHMAFYEHPPLMMWMLAAWFSLFGTSMLAAKMYALAMMVLAAVLLVAVWRQLGFDRSTGWLPLLLWMMIFDVALLSCNNFIESTMLLFVLASVWCILKGGWWNIGGGAMLALAFFTKGPTGLFPLVLPLLLWAFGLRKKGFWHMVGETAVVLASAVVPLVLLCLAVPDAADYLRRYVDGQVLASLPNGNRSRAYIIGAFFGRSALVIAVAAVAVLTGLKWKRWEYTDRHWRTAAMLFALALCGCLPMMVSTKQYPHYLLCDFPFMALAAAVLVEPAARRCERYTTGTAATIAACLALVGGVALNVAHCGKPGRDQAMIEDMETILPQLEEGEMVTIPDPLVFRYNLHGYYYFYHHVSLDQHAAHRHLLTDSELGLREWDGQYREVPLPTTEYRLYQLLEE